ncbi:MAG: lysylphosphatidylglycerol synthase transmembrane domain-containing protein [Candidatus Gastranaerophilaceae bacterium]
MKKILGILVTLVFVFLIFYKLDFHALLKAFSSLNPACFLVFLPIYFSTFIFRGFRWKFLLPEIKKSSMTSVLDYMFIGYFLNTILPARAGDFYRSYLIGKDYDVKKVKVFASVFLERIFDGSIVLLFLLYSIISFFREPWVYNLAIGVGLFFWGGFIVLLILAKFGHPEKLFRKTELFFQKLPVFLQNHLLFGLNQTEKHLKSFEEGLSIFHSFSDILVSFIFTAITWFIEITLIYIVIRSYGLNIGYMAAVFTLSLTVFSAMIPVSSTFFGPYQYAFIIGLAVFGISKEQALAISLTTQFAVFILIALGGAVALMKKHTNIFNIKKEISSHKELISEE